MALLTTQRNTPEKADRNLIAVPVEANTYIYLGAMVALDANGYAVPAQTFGAGNLAAIRVLGRAERVIGATPGSDANNTGGAAGAVMLVARRGCFELDNDGTITQANVGQAAFANDDHSASAGTAVAAAVVAIGATPAGSVIALAGRPVVRGSVIVTNDPDTKTYAEGTDYVVDYEGGAIILPVGTTITASANVLVSYTHGGNRPVLGRIVEYAPDGVWVDTFERFGVSQL